MIDRAIAVRRTAAQIADPMLAWQRPDKNFFAAGDCHILAFQAAKRWSSTRIIHVRPRNSERGHHVFATEEDGAIEVNDWSDRVDLVRPPNGLPGDVLARFNRYLDPFGEAGVGERL